MRVPLQVLNFINRIQRVALHLVLKRKNYLSRKDVRILYLWGKRLPFILFYFIVFAVKRRRKYISGRKKKGCASRGNPSVAGAGVVC